MGQALMLVLESALIEVLESALFEVLESTLIEVLEDSFKRNCLLSILYLSTFFILVLESIQQEIQPAFVQF